MKYIALAFILLAFGYANESFSKVSFKKSLAKIKDSDESTFDYIKIFGDEDDIEEQLEDIGEDLDETVGDIDDERSENQEDREDSSDDKTDFFFLQRNKIQKIMKLAQDDDYYDSDELSDFIRIFGDEDDIDDNLEDIDEELQDLDDDRIDELEDLDDEIQENQDDMEDNKDDRTDDYLLAQKSQKLMRV